MGCLFRKSLAILVLFLIIPVGVFFSHWQWQPTSLNALSQPLFWLTETATAPWAAGTSFLLWLLFGFCLKIKTKKEWGKLLLILFFAIIAGQVVKSAIKNLTTEPRPFVLWMQTEYHVDSEHFYSLDRDERALIVKNTVTPSTQIPLWLSEHWQNETGYSFPSGHMMFAATWAFIALFLLNLKKYRLVISLIIIWALGMEISRLGLGMHHPIDVIASSFFAWLIGIIVYLLAKKWNIIGKS